MSLTPRFSGVGQGRGRRSTVSTVSMVSKKQLKSTSSRALSRSAELHSAVSQIFNLLPSLQTNSAACPESFRRFSNPPTAGWPPRCGCDCGAIGRNTSPTPALYFRQDHDVILAIMFGAFGTRRVVHQVPFDRLALCLHPFRGLLAPLSGVPVGPFEDL